MGTKVCSNGPGHITKMAVTPIYGKNPLKIFSRTIRYMTLGLKKVCSNGDVGPTKLVQMMILG